MTTRITCRNVVVAIGLPVIVGSRIATPDISPITPSSFMANRPRMG
ncbi:MAG: hypothetical protein WCI26_08045 [Acidimicrobiales bacterium]